MKEDTTNKNDSTLTTFLAGGAVGAALGLLLAPKPGRELRNDLKRIADRFSQAADIGSKKDYLEEIPLEHAVISNGRSSRLVPILRAGLIGAGIGAGIALLLAPKPGSETREDVKHFALGAREKVVSAIDKGKDIYAAGKEAATGIPYCEGKQEDMHVV